MAVNDSLNLQDSCEPAPENCEEALSLLAFLVGQNFNLPLTNLCMRFFKNLGVSFFPENWELLWSLLKYI